MHEIAPSKEFENYSTYKSDVYNDLCRSYDEQAFDNMSEESEEKKNSIIKKSLRPVPSQGMVEQAKKHGGFRPQRGHPGYALRLQRAR